MKQIGARQEAGRIGGIGPCGRELCCSTWMTNFISVSTSAARFQDLSLNPQKLAGQCAKLKCCLNYEVDQYVESLKRLPSKEIVLQTQDNDYYFFKADILNHIITYSTDKHILANESTISARRAFEIIKMNREGKKPEALTEDGAPVEVKSLDLLEQENINRFDKAKKKKKKRKDTPSNERRANDSRNNENRNNNAPEKPSHESVSAENGKNPSRRNDNRNRQRRNSGGGNRPKNGEQQNTPQS
jgi:hypothetical protein